MDLEALVEALKDFISDFDELYAAIIRNECFKDITREQVKKYY